MHRVGGVAVDDDARDHHRVDVVVALADAHRYILEVALDGSAKDGRQIGLREGPRHLPARRPIGAAARRSGGMPELREEPAKADLRIEDALVAGELRGWLELAGQGIGGPL